MPPALPCPVFEAKILVGETEAQPEPAKAGSGPACQRRLARRGDLGVRSPCRRRCRSHPSHPSPQVSHIAGVLSFHCSKFPVHNWTSRLHAHLGSWLVHEPGQVVFGVAEPACLSWFKRSRSKTVSGAGCRPPRFAPPRGLRLRPLRRPSVRPKASLASRFRIRLALAGPPLWPALRRMPRYRSRSPMLPVALSCCMAVRTLSVGGLTGRPGLPLRIALAGWAGSMRIRVPSGNSNMTGPRTLRMRTIH